MQSLTVRHPDSLWLPNKVTKNEVIQVARGAQEKVLLGKEEPPDRQGFCDRVRDTFSGGVKKTAKSQIHDLSHHTAALHLELEKPEQQRNGVTINTHSEQIQLSQKKITELAGGHSLEYGRIGERAVVGKDSYMIYRSPEKICPTGIPLYSPEEPTEEPTGRAIPTFISVDDIGVDHIRQIRNSGPTSDDGVLRCEGIEYKIRFTGLSTPMIVFHSTTGESERLQIKLFELWQQNPHLFALNPPIPPTPATRPVLPGLPQTTGPVVPAPATSFVQTRLAPIPSFDTDQQVNNENFDQILAAGKLICAGTLYRVATEQQGEPVVLCDDSSPATRGIQLMLFRIWITRKAAGALTRLQTINSDSALYLPPEKTDTERFRTRALFGLDKIWEAQTGLVNTDFREIVSRLQKISLAKKTELEKTFNSIVNNTIPAAKQRSEFQEGEKRLNDLIERQEPARKNIDDLRKIYRELFLWARDCTTSELQSIVLGRIRQFNDYLKNFFAKTELNLRLVDELNSIMQKQMRFVKQFTKVQMLLLDQVYIELNDGSKVRVPEPEIMPKLRELSVNLKRLSSDHASPPEELEKAIRIFEREQGRIVTDLAAKLNYGLELQEVMKSFKGRNGEGLNQDTNQSYYTPGTFARLVSIKNMRDELLNRSRYMTRDELDRARAECGIHLQHVRAETDEIARYAQTAHFQQHQMYVPQKNVSGPSYMNYEQYCDDLRSREAA